MRERSQADWARHFLSEHRVGQRVGEVLKVGHASQLHLNVSVIFSVLDLLASINEQVGRGSKHLLRISLVVSDASKVLHIVILKL